MEVPPPAPSASSMITSPVSSPTFPVPMPTFPVPMPTFPAMTGAIDPNNCSGEGGRAQQCGASANRPPMCCEGFVCTPGNAKVSNGGSRESCEIVAMLCLWPSDYLFAHCLSSSSLVNHCIGYLHSCRECSCDRRGTGGSGHLRWRGRAGHGVWCCRRSSSGMLPRSCLRRGCWSEVCGNSAADPTSCFWSDFAAH